jgi:hypothetical protein
MFGWTDPKMPARYIAQANREKLGGAKQIGAEGHLAMLKWPLHADQHRSHPHKKRCGCRPAALRLLLHRQ